MVIYYFRSIIFEVRKSIITTLGSSRGGKMLLFPSIVNLFVRPITLSRQKLIKDLQGKRGGKTEIFVIYFSQLYRDKGKFKERKEV